MAFHRYVVSDNRNNEEALTVFYRLAFVASLLASCLAAGSHYLAGLYPALAITITPPATYVLYRSLADLTTRWLWKTKMGGLLGVRTLDVAGKWRAEIKKRDVAGTQTTDTGLLCIEQTWRMISITLDTPLTESNSLSASLVLDAGFLRVEYQYYAKKKVPQGGLFADHVGSASLSIPLESDTPLLGDLQLNYFTNHGEGGKIRLRRE